MKFLDGRLGKERKEEQKAFWKRILEGCLSFHRESRWTFKKVVTEMKAYDYYKRLDAKEVGDIGVIRMERAGFYLGLNHMEEGLVELTWASRLIQKLVQTIEFMLKRRFQWIMERRYGDQELQKLIEWSTEKEVEEIDRDQCAKI
mgnify:FL=1